MVFSGISCGATASLLLYLSYQAIKDRKNRKPKPSPQGFFWLVNLFVAGIPYDDMTHSDFVQSFTSLFASRFLTTNSVSLGPLCTFQAIGLISGDVGSAIWTFVITIHTFLLLAGGRHCRAWVAEKSASGKLRWVFCGVTWLFIIFSGLFGLIFFSGSETPYCTIFQASGIYCR